MKEIVFENITKDIVNCITSEQAWFYNIVPFMFENNSLSILIDKQKNNNNIQSELEVILGRQVKLIDTDSEIIYRGLQIHYRRTEQKPSSTYTNLNIGESDDFLRKLITEAKSLGSSDIHIEIYEEKCRIRLRMDGHLIERYQLSKNEYPYLINQLKIKANIEITEKRLPQDGRINFRNEHYKFDIRVSVLPTLHGEKIVLRILSNDAANIDLLKLGFNHKQLNDYIEGTKRPHGILLISGPTGSGKTTTLYATLKLLNKEDVNILTIEDPIEYTLPGINQVQLHEDIGLTFGSALRTFLRQDPDIIMVGEIRDPDTAQMAVRSALTGHLVLSTIHTNSAWGTISRLTDMGVPPYLIANTLNTSVAQRLVRLLCNHCKKEIEFNSSALPPGVTLPENISKHHIAKGCEHCHFTGYNGRKAIYEVVTITQEFVEEIKMQKQQPNDLYSKHKISTLANSAFELLKRGESSLDEVYSILAGG
jgi:general secretion pathway protein E/type IV pilus assembly protein PilB